MNVVFTVNAAGSSPPVRDDKLNALFVSEAEAKRIVGLAGHRSVKNTHSLTDMLSRTGSAFTLLADVLTASFFAVVCSSVGGLRASLYNAVSLESVQALVDFMADFQKRHTQ